MACVTPIYGISGHQRLPLDMLMLGSRIWRFASQCNPQTNFDLNGTMWSTWCPQVLAFMYICLILSMSAHLGVAFSFVALLLEAELFLKALLLIGT
jgi:hypothetical protein